MHRSIMTSLAILVLLTISLCSDRCAATFTDIAAGLPGVARCAVAWGDYDNDGDLDLLLTGNAGAPTSPTRVSRVYRNDNGVFTLGAELLGLQYSAAVWGDIDNDGDLDIVLTGESSTTHAHDSRTYRNDAGTFTSVSSGVYGAKSGSLALGDYDNDGDLDLLKTGEEDAIYPPYPYASRVYQNDGNGYFTDIGAGLPAQGLGTSTWADYDHDGDLDILLAGTRGPEMRLYRNDGDGNFTDAIDFSTVFASSASWQDYNRDGRLDFVMSGGYLSFVTRVYKYSYPGFVDIGAGLPAASGWVAWGDYDSDGDPDILYAQSAGTTVYRNDAGSFVDVAAGLQGFIEGQAAWGDYDADGDLDIALAGWTGSQAVTRIYRNDGVPANTPPSAPTDLVVASDGDQWTLSWVKSSDAEQYDIMNNYNVRIGTTPGGNEICPAMADPASGHRRVAQLGNVQDGTSWSIRMPPEVGAWYWSVQAIDNSYAGSAFAPELNVNKYFKQVASGLPPVWGATARWGDYDNDGDLDLLLAGTWAPGYVSYVYRNDSGTFVDIGAGLAGATNGDGDWGDYDNDGDLDILLSGYTSTSTRALRIYRNDSGTFVDSGLRLIDVGQGSVAWGDYDNDGRLDILLTGTSSSGVVSRVYHNEGGAFTDIEAGMVGVMNGDANWADYDNDGDLDALIAGTNGTDRYTRLYRNDNGVFTAGQWLVGMDECSSAWGDYDNDGDLDLLLVGKWNSIQRYAYLYRNDAGQLVNSGISLPAVSAGAADWGDFDNDGDLDVLLSGWTGTTYRSYVCRNDGGAFADIGAALNGCTEGQWGDYDNDNDLDLLLAGRSGDVGHQAVTVYQNLCQAPNTPPDAPTGLTAQVEGGAATLSWLSASDAQTAASGLSYNLRLGTTPGGNEVAAGMADAISGYRRVVQLGNANKRTSWKIDLPGPGVYYWSVQAIDAAYAGSPFAQEKSIDLVSFSGVGANLPAVSGGAAAWGDYDNDGDLDVLLTGATVSTQISRVYRNDNGVFTDIAAGLAGVSGGVAAWGDYDGDGDLDILLGGYVTETDESIVRVYRNDEGAFTDIAAGLPGLHFVSGDWGDYDNDGDLDLLLAGWMLGGPPWRHTRVYRNDDGVFTDIGAGLPGVEGGAVAWADYDNDGDLDIVLAGRSDVEEIRIARVYRNDSGTFADIGAGLPGAENAAVAWGDYDNDGDLDLLLTGSNYDLGYFARIYRNDAGTFSDIGAALTTADGAGSLGWGDYDNDGDLDVLFSGLASTSVYRNDGGGSFADIGAVLPLGASVWGDFDNDGDLDVLVAGMAATELYRNNCLSPNTPPAAPGGLTASVADYRVTLSWGASEDSQTPAAGLSYNLRLGTIPGGGEVCPAMANTATGYRRVVRLGNAQERTSWTIDLPSESRAYYWSVQAIDGAFAGSPFAVEHSFQTGVLFADAGAALPGLERTAAAWGDYDSDDDLDLLVTGYTGSAYLSRVYRSDPGGYVDIAAALPGVADGSVAWGDFDNDGDLDILLAGYTGSSSVCGVYRNDEGEFTDTAAGLPGLRDCSVAWGDYDNDGDLDILLAGLAGSTPVSRVYRNDDGAFTNSGAVLTGVRYGSVAWGDHDNDGDLDILLAGWTGSAYRTRIYRNDFGTFTNIGGGLAWVGYSAAAWGDYDSDGDLDILLTGQEDGGIKSSRVYRNDGGTFTDIAAGLVGVMRGTSGWGDYDNDGDLDILLTGDTGSGYVSRIYRNDGAAAFTDVAASLPGVYASAAGWGDCDRDGDLDMLLAGNTGAGLICRIYRAAGAPANSPPSAPSDLAFGMVGDKLTMTWLGASDDRTPPAGLSYNVRIGTTADGCEVFAGMASSGSGYRRVPQLGNAQEKLSWTVALPPLSGPYYWTVQAVDGGYEGGPFAAPQSFSLPTGLEDLPAPMDYALLPSEPNPFNPATTIGFSLARPERVRLAVYDAAGRRVRLLVDETRAAGRYETRWDGTADGGRKLASGVYFCRMEAGTFRATQRLTLVK